ncbi:MAG TPA: hypothetical protein ENO22_11720 [candidate division Zixibacteria bacterium]|nr:hypothetical protein [candidate division Zixibacteria bacterium]
MLKKALTIALAIMFVTSVTAFACGGDKSASKTAEVQKVSSEKYACGDKAEATARTAAVNSEKSSECAYTKALKSAEAAEEGDATVKTAAVTGEKSECTAKKASAESNCSRDAAVKTAASEKSGTDAACLKYKDDLKNSADESKKEIDVSKTAMADEK